jgi:predicted Fe-Mo cluster-binding NifX family protein
MKVAVTAQGPEISCDLDSRFGRANCFIVVDTESGTSQIIDNAPNLNAAQGAGVQAAQTVAGLEVDAVMTGHCGPKAFRVLDAAGIQIYLGAEGTVEAALKDFRAGKYQPANKPDVEGHW